MDRKPTLAGKIKNSGTQKVDALFPQAGPKGNKTTKGGDLRTGKGGDK